MSEIGFGITRLLGFDLLPRIKQINKVKLYRVGPGQTDRHPRLAPAMTRPIRWDLIAQQYDQMIKYATAIRTATASTEALLRRFTCAATHPTYQGMPELGRAQKTIFTARYLRLRELQREINAGLNVVELWNCAGEVIAYGKLGARDQPTRRAGDGGRLPAHPSSRPGVREHPHAPGRPRRSRWADALVGEADRCGLTPLFWSNVLPYGEVRLDMASRLALGTG